MGSIKDRNGLDLTEAEDIKKSRAKNFSAPLSESYFKRRSAAYDVSFPFS